MSTEIRLGPVYFAAAHTGLHNGVLEPLHGHSYTVTARLTGHVDAAAMLVDFTLAMKVLHQIIAPLHRRTLVAGEAENVSIDHADSHVTMRSRERRYQFPDTDVVILPVVNTSTEAIAEWLADQLWTSLAGRGITRIAVDVAESPDFAATAHTPGTTVK